MKKVNSEITVAESEGALDSMGGTIDTTDLGGFFGSDLFQPIVNFFQRIADFFRSLFKK